MVSSTNRNHVEGHSRASRESITMPRLSVKITVDLNVKTNFPAITKTDLEYLLDQQMEKVFNLERDWDEGFRVPVEMSYSWEIEVK